LRSERTAFEELRRIHVTPFEKAEDFEGPDIDPLAEDASVRAFAVTARIARFANPCRIIQNPWEQFRKDEALRKEIFQDVERCMPENPYFRDPKIQTSLLNILFIYCKLNEDVSYRQGMHEIVAVILWVVSCDAIAPGFSIDVTVEQSLHEDDSVMAETLDARYIEHDTFSLFQVIMRSAKGWYELGEEDNTKNRGRSENRASSPIVEKSKYIHEHLLMSVDPELAEHLKALDVLPQVFLMCVLSLLPLLQEMLMSG
jgi:TBC1 domain family protein 5